MPQVWAIDTDGGYMYADNLSRVLRTALQPACKFRQFCDVKDGTLDGTGTSLHVGEKFHWNVYSDVQDQGGAIAETATMPETEFKITQGELQVTEYGNSVPYTSKLDDLSEQPVKEIIHKVMKPDAKKAFDFGAVAQFRRTNLKVQPVGGNSPNNVVVRESVPFTDAVSVQLSKEHVKSIVDGLKERNIEPYQGDDFFALGRPTGFRTFKNELEDVHQYVDAGFQMILHGEIGRYEGCRFVEQTHVRDGAYDAATLGGLATDPHLGVPVNNTKTAGVFNFEYADGNANDIFFFGGDTVAEALVIPEEIRGRIPSDYGRSRGIAWYYLGGFGLAHGYDAATVSQARIMWWGSNG